MWNAQKFVKMVIFYNWAQNFIFGVIHQLIIKHCASPTDRELCVQLELEWSCSVFVVVENTGVAYLLTDHSPSQTIHVGGMCSQVNRILQFKMWPGNQGFNKIHLV